MFENVGLRQKTPNPTYRAFAAKKYFLKIGEFSASSNVITTQSSFKGTFCYKTKSQITGKLLFQVNYSVIYS